jgi:fructose-bisphosphate aldolase class II
MLATLHEVLQDAKKQHYAVGLFNTVNLEMAKGVLSAAEEAKSPVIIGTAEVLLPYAELDELSYFLLPLAKRASVPVVLHYDHGLTEARVKQAIDLGFTSVMYDCSTLDFEGNCRAVAELTDYAHRRGVTVEGELGHVGANDGSAEGEAEGDHSLYTEPDEALRFAQATGVDALAVSIGTAHGAYKSKPCLDFDRLAAIATLVDPPLVLHGGSGLSDEDFRRAIQNGIAKVNIFTDINAAQAQAACGAYRPGMGMTDLMPAMTEAVKQATLAKMRLFGCVGRG